jgi:hypothetical protein
MINVTKHYKNLVLFVDLTNFQRTLRVDIINPTNYPRSKGHVQASGFPVVGGVQASGLAAS